MASRSGRFPAWLGSLAALLALLLAACSPSVPAPTPAPPPKPAAQPTAQPPAAAAPTAAPTAAPKPTTAAPAPPPASKPTAAPTAASRINVNLRLGWLASGQHAPLYLTLAKGFYAEEGLDVQINEGTGSLPVVQSVGAGRDAFGYLDRSTMALALGQGTPAKAIAGILQTSPITVASRAQANVRKPKDLEGKTLALTPASSHQMVIAFLKANGVDESKVNIASAGAQQLPVMLQAGSADAIPAYLVDLYLELRKKTELGPPMLIADWGVNPVAEGLVTSVDLIKTKPDLVRRFVRASLKGYAYTKDHLDEAAEALVKQLPDRDRAMTREQVEQTMKLVESDATRQNGLGYQAEAQWKQSQDLLAQYGGLKQTSNDLSVYYTNEFLK